MSTPTPRTDARATALAGYRSSAWVHANFARTLETELNSANSRIADLETEIRIQDAKLTRADNAIESLTRQLTSAREDGARLDHLEKNRLWITLHYGRENPPWGSFLPIPFEGYTIGDIETPSPDLRSAIDVSRGVSGRTETPASEETVPASTWQPIETAPKDGTNILVSNGLFVHEARWSGAQWCMADTWENWWVGVTHWQPLPPPPTTSKNS